MLHFVTAIILRHTTNMYEICNCKPHHPKANFLTNFFHSNRSTFEQVIAKIQRGPDFMNHGVFCGYHRWPALMVITFWQHAVVSIGFSLCLSLERERRAIAVRRCAIIRVVAIFTVCMLTFAKVRK